MAGTKSRKVRRAGPKLPRVPERAAGWKPKPFWVALAGFAVAVLIFYWNPLTDPNATLQWDAIDYHYSVQKFAGEELRSFRLPHWNEFSYSGFPFLADPQVGTWYPLNWPFFLAGVTAKALQWEIAVHVLLALIGAWLLAGVWLPNPWHAGIAAVLYGFSGFFAGHASHIGMLQSAAWLPLLLYGLHCSIRSGDRRTVVLTGAGCAAMFLAGHFQCAIYSFAAFGIYGFVVAAQYKRWGRALAVLAACAALTLLLSAVQWLPTLELAGQSIRAAMKFDTRTNAPLEARALWTLVSPDHYGSVSGNYTGPDDRTQFYFYSGLALLPLALLGLLAGRTRWPALALILPFGWYAFGPAAGLYRVAVRLPGFGAVRAPVHAWFIVALGLALLGGAGAAMLSARIKLSWLAAILALIVFFDVYYWNSLKCHLAYDHSGSFETRYGMFQDNFEQAVKRLLPKGTRFYSPTASFGPLNAAYDIRIPVTYGYNPLPLRRYVEYAGAATGNRNLLNALNVGLLVSESGSPNAGMLPKFFFPKRLTAVSDAQSLALLPSADPAQNALVEGAIDGLVQDPAAKATVLAAGEQRYLVRCLTASPSLLRAAIPWYPGWQAIIDGRQVATRVVDHALIGIPVPAGTHEVVLEYRDRAFNLGSAITLLSIFALLGAGIIQKRAGRSKPSPASVSA